jgi:hypothetical protein
MRSFTLRKKSRVFVNKVLRKILDTTNKVRVDYNKITSIFYTLQLFFLDGKGRTGTKRVGDVKCKRNVYIN